MKGILLKDDAKMDLLKPTMTDMRKKIAGRILIAFFAVMIVLTLLSNTINNFTLPRVKVVNPKESMLLKQAIGEGEIEAKEKMDMYFDVDVNVKVEDVLVKAGDTVKKGDILIKFRKEDLEKEIRQDALQLEKMRFTYQENKKTVSSGAGLQKLRIVMEMAKDDLDESKRKYEVVQQLNRSGAESDENVRLAERAKDIAQVNYEASVKSYNSEKENEEAGLKILEYDLKIQEMGLENLRNKYDFSGELAAPFDGTVQEVYITKGVWVGSSSKLCTLTETSEGFEFKGDIDVDNVDFIKAGDAAIVRIKALGSDPLNGQVKEVKESEKNKGTMKQVIVTVSNDKLLGGEKGDVKIEQNTTNFKLVVPNSAILPGVSDKIGSIRVLKEKKGFLGTEYYIRVIDAFILDSDDNSSAITAAVSAQDRIIYKTDKPLYDNSRVRIDYSSGK